MWISSTDANFKRALGYELDFSSRHVRYTLPLRYVPRSHRYPFYFYLYDFNTPRLRFSRFPRCMHASSRSWVTIIGDRAAYKVKISGLPAFVLRKSTTLLTLTLRPNRRSDCEVSCQRAYVARHPVCYVLFSPVRLCSIGSAFPRCDVSTPSLIDVRGGN